MAHYYYTALIFFTALPITAYLFHVVLAVYLRKLYLRLVVANELILRTVDCITPTVEKRVENMRGTCWNFYVVDFMELVIYM